MPTNTNPFRVLKADSFNDKGYTNENSLAALQITKPDRITPVLTHLMGRDSDKFPLTFLTEGQKGGMYYVNDIQYEWDVIKKLRNSDIIVSSAYTSNDSPGKNYTYFQAVFDTQWLKKDHLIVSPSGTVAQVKGRPTPDGTGHYLYNLQLVDPDANAFCPVEDLLPGVRWAMEGGAPVSESFSNGNESNTQAPGKMRNQLSILRKSYRIGGNISNKVVEVALPGKNGGTTNKWILWEEFQHKIQWMQAVEEHLWWSTYNRRADGSIPLKNDENNLPIPIGAGVVDQIPNRDTYGILDFKKIKNTVSDVLYGATDTGQMVITLYTGEGGAEEFHDAIMAESKSFAVWSGPVGEKLVKGEGMNLKFGAYFGAYVTPQNHLVIVKKLRMLDHGARAEVAPRHPRTGKPMTSYEMFFVDQSVYDGEPNLKMVSQKERESIRGLLPGMAPMPDPFTFKGNALNIISSENDSYAVHFLCSKGVVIRRNTHCFRLSCDLN